MVSTIQPYLIVAVDMDGVIADLHTEWLDSYNKDYNDNLTTDKMVDWDIMRMVKPECGIKILDYLRDADFYRRVKPVEGALEGIKYLRRLGCEVVYATSCVYGSEAIKLDWLYENGFLAYGDPRKGPAKDVIIAYNKKLVAADVLIDDRHENVVTFPGYGVVFDTLYNKKTPAFDRLKGWKDIKRVWNNITADKLIDQGVVA